MEKSTSQGSSLEKSQTRQPIQGTINSSNKNNKQTNTNKLLIKRILSLVSTVITALSFVFAFVFWGRDTELFEDMGESSGVLCIVLLCLLMVLYVVMEILKRKWYPVVTKKIVVFMARYLNYYHEPIAFLGMACLIAHSLFAFSGSGWIWSEYLRDGDVITGLICTGLMAFSWFAGLFAKKHRKPFWSIHVVFAFVSFIPLIIHFLSKHCFKYINL